MRVIQKYFILFLLMFAASVVSSAELVKSSTAGSGGLGTEFAASADFSYTSSPTQCCNGNTGNGPASTCTSGSTMMSCTEHMGPSCPNGGSCPGAHGTGCREEGETEALRPSDEEEEDVEK